MPLPLDFIFYGWLRFSQLCPKLPARWRTYAKPLEASIDKRIVAPFESCQVSATKSRHGNVIRSSDRQKAEADPIKREKHSFRNS